MPEIARCAAIFALTFPLLLPAQSATLSGTATDARGKPIANAAVSLKSAAGPAVEVRTDAAGNYSIPNLAPGDYTLSATGEGLSSKPIVVTVTNAPHQTVDLLLTAAGPGQELPSAPSSAQPAPASPSLGDLGFSAQQTQANPNCRQCWKSARACCGFIRNWD